MLKLFSFFLLENNCFIILYWPLPYININQPQVYICPLVPVFPHPSPIPYPPPTTHPHGPVAQMYQDRAELVGGPDPYPQVFPSPHSWMPDRHTHQEPFGYPQNSIGGKLRLPRPQGSLTSTWSASTTAWPLGHRKCTFL